MTDGNCIDCGIAYDLHSWVDGVCVCPHGFASSSLWEGCRENLDVNPCGAAITCPSRYPQDTPTEYAHSTNHSGSSPDPLDFLSVLNKQRSQRRNPATRRSDQLGDVPTIPLRRSARLENRRRAQESVEPYAQTQGRRSSLRMTAESARRSRPRRMSLQDRRRPSGSSYENEAVLPAQKHPIQRLRRESLQPHVLNRMVPVEDMDPFVGFQPFTDLEPGKQRDPVTVREPMKDLQRPPLVFEWNASVVFPEVGGMRVRVGRFGRIGRPVDDTTTSSLSRVNDGNERNNFSSSGSEGYFTAQDWSSSSSSTPDHPPSNHVGPGIDASPLHAASPPSLPSPPGLQPEFIQGSSGSGLLLTPQTVACVPGDPYPSFSEQELPQFKALAQHYIAVQDAGNRAAPSQLTPLPGYTTEPAHPVFTPPPSMVLQQPEGPEIQYPQQASYNVTPVQDPSPPTQPPQSSALARRPRRSTMPCTLPGTKTADYRSDSSPSLPARATELVVEPSVDWATREPWEYIHRVLTSSTCPLVVLLKTPTTDIPAAVLGALGEELQVQGMVVNNERWLLIGPRDVDLDKFRVGFQERAEMPGKFAVRFGNLAWGADVNQIEDEVVKAVIENAMRGGGTPATLPAVFMAGTLGGLAVWYALSLM